MEVRQEPPRRAMRSERPLEYRAHSVVPSSEACVILSEPPQHARVPAPLPWRRGPLLVDRRFPPSEPEGARTLMFGQSGAEKMNMRSVYLPRAGRWPLGRCWSLLAAVVPARAQYGRPSMEDPAIGEKYHVEADLNFWNPDLDATVSERVARHRRERDRRQVRPGLRRQVDPRVPLRAAARQASTSSASPTRRSSTRAT